ncbi:hypothetical protein MXB_4298 [Myxobolus squamalis]|nr:hypothetical protein MXB_4298 [Myxobolus squamalis]
MRAQTHVTEGAGRTRKIESMNREDSKYKGDRPLFDDNIMINCPATKITIYVLAKKGDTFTGERKWRIVDVLFRFVIPT